MRGGCPMHPSSSQNFSESFWIARTPAFTRAFRRAMAGNDDPCLRLKEIRRDSIGAPMHILHGPYGVVRMPDKVPVTVLTGYLGADEEIFEMNNGCVCCTVRGDLVRIIDGLMRRKGKFDAIIVETTGLADPAPVAQTFFMDDNVGRKAKLDAVVTVADAKWLKNRLKDAPEAKNQIAFADIILLNKADLVAADELGEVEARIRGINPYAKLHKTERCKIPLPEVLGRNAFDLDRILEIEPEFLDGHHHHDHDHDHDHDHAHHHHDGGLKHSPDEEMQSVSLKTNKP